ncbi:uncharacterized protein BDR25DRAFT_362273, partial [Lindgomyces ingoldianus]
PSIFPGVLRSFARIFGLAIDDLRRRFEATGSTGLGVALAEGVSALDRLGSYCFTGFPRSLMGSVLKPLGTIDGIERGAWPYINPRMLDLQGGGTLSLAQWPRGKNGRPLLMHVASIAFHYGSEVAASRYSNVWFQELGGIRAKGPSGVAEFLEEMFRELWFSRTLNKGSRSQRGSGTQESEEHQRELVRQWSQSRKPFSGFSALTSRSNREYEPVFSLFVSRDAALPTFISTKTRRDFAEELYNSSMQSNGSANKSFTSSASNSTLLRSVTVTAHNPPTAVLLARSYAVTARPVLLKLQSLNQISGINLVLLDEMRDNMVIPVDNFSSSAIALEVAPLAEPNLHLQAVLVLVHQVCAVEPNLGGLTIATELAFTLSHSMVKETPALRLPRNSFNKASAPGAGEPSNRRDDIPHFAERSRLERIPGRSWLRRIPGMRLSMGKHVQSGSILLGNIDFLRRTTVRRGRDVSRKLRLKKQLRSRTTVTYYGLLEALFTSQNATWFSVLRAAARYTATSSMSRELWIGALCVAMISSEVECMPGSYQSRLSYRRRSQQDRAALNGYLGRQNTRPNVH